MTVGSLNPSHAPQIWELARQVYPRSFELAVDDLAAILEDPDHLCSSEPCGDRFSSEICSTWPWKAPTALRPSASFVRIRPWWPVWATNWKPFITILESAKASRCAGLATDQQLLLEQGVESFQAGSLGPQMQFAKGFLIQLQI